MFSRTLPKLLQQDLRVGSTLPSGRKTCNHNNDDKAKGDIPWMTSKDRRQKLDRTSKIKLLLPEPLFPCNIIPPSMSGAWKPLPSNGMNPMYPGKTLVRVVKTTSGENPPKSDNVSRLKKEGFFRKVSDPWLKKIRQRYKNEYAEPRSMLERELSRKNITSIAKSAKSKNATTPIKSEISENIISPAKSKTLEIGTSLKSKTSKNATSPAKSKTLEIGISPLKSETSKNATSPRKNETSEKIISPAKSKTFKIGTSLKSETSKIATSPLKSEKLKNITFSTKSKTLGIATSPVKSERSKTVTFPTESEISKNATSTAKSETLQIANSPAKSESLKLGQKSSTNNVSSAKRETSVTSNQLLQSQSKLARQIVNAKTKPKPVDRFPANSELSSILLKEPKLPKDSPK